MDLVSSHPNFNAAKVITEKEHRFIRAVVPSEEEGYSAWKKLINKDAKIL